MDSKQLQLLKRLLNRPSASHKYDFGHVVVLGGAPGMVGAPLLTAKAALRTGAGLATIASANTVIDKLERRVEEVMTVRLPEDMAMSLKALADFIAERKVGALAVGPGLSPAAAPLIKQLLRTLSLPVVLDAGGLAAYIGDLEVLRSAAQHNPNIILTPHPGEFARLLDHSLPSDNTAIKRLVSDTAQANDVTIVLKGHHSIVAGPKRAVYINKTGNPGLATAGTGDVLTGMIAGLLAQDVNAFDAACCGVYLHGLAGDLAAAAKTEVGLIAGDVIDFIPTALRKIYGS